MNMSTATGKGRKINRVIMKLCTGSATRLANMAADVSRLGTLLPLCLALAEAVLKFGSGPSLYLVWVEV